MLGHLAFINQPQKLFWEVNEIYWNPGSSIYHSDVFFKGKYLTETTVCHGKTKKEIFFPHVIDIYII